MTDRAHFLALAARSVRLALRYSAMARRDHPGYLPHPIAMHYVGVARRHIATAMELTPPERKP